MLRRLHAENRNANYEKRLEKIEKQMKLLFSIFFGPEDWIPPLDAINIEHVRNRLGKWLFGSNERWSQVICSGPDQLSPPKTGANNRKIYQLTLESDPIVLIGFLSSQMIGVLQDPLFAMKNPSEMVMFIESYKSVKNLLKHCRYEKAVRCWILESGNNNKPIRIKVEQNSY